MTKSVYFFSDVHLGAADARKEAEKERKLIRFLESIQGNAEAVYILGDLFDFWFEYKFVMPKEHFRTLCKLGEFACNVDVTYIGGNHDFWVGTFFQNQLDIRYCEEPISVSHQGKQIYLHHGDGLIKKDVGYRFLRRVLRNPINIFLFRLIHPDVGFWIANHVSHGSRKHTSQKEFNRAAEDMLAFAAEKCAEGNDAVILAHTHSPTKQSVENGLYLNTGDWIDKFSYVELNNGVFYLKYFDVK